QGRRQEAEAVFGRNLWPAAQDIVEGWGSASPVERGRLVGALVGEGGIDALLTYGTGAAARGLTKATSSALGKVLEGGLRETAVIASSSVATPYGPALQSTSEAALAARAQVEGGAKLYRIGTMGRSGAGEAQFWALEAKAGAKVLVTRSSWRRSRAVAGA